MNKMLFSFAFFPFSPSTLAPLRVNHGCKALICVSHLIKLLHAKQWEMWQDEAKRDFVVIFHLKEDLFKRKWCRIRKMTIATQIVDGHVYTCQFVQRCRLALHIVSKKLKMMVHRPLSRRFTQIFLKHGTFKLFIAPRPPVFGDI